MLAAIEDRRPDGIVRETAVPMFPAACSAIAATAMLPRESRKIGPLPPIDEAVTPSGGERFAQPGPVASGVVDVDAFGGYAERRQGVALGGEVLRLGGVRRPLTSDGFSVR